MRCDEARSAATPAGRDALQSLLTASKISPPPFDCLMVDDTSRLARYLPDVLSMNDKLQYNGVFIYAVAQRLDCREKTSRPLLTLHGMMDEQFLVSLGEKVHRGQEGRALKGLQPGGKCYGYRMFLSKILLGAASMGGLQSAAYSSQSSTKRRQWLGASSRCTRMGTAIYT